MANSITQTKMSLFHLFMIGMKAQAHSLFVLLMFVPCFVKAQNIFPASGAAGVGTTTPDASSLFELKSTSKGILISRMTKNQRDAIVAPATGLLIFQTNSTPGFYYFDGTQWVAVAAKGPNKALSNLTAPTAVNVDLLSGANNTINLGSAVNSWKNLYVGGSIYVDGFRFIDNPGTGNTLLGNIGNGAISGSNNTFTGETSGAGTSAGSDNSFFGQAAGYTNTTGGSNCFFGKAAGYWNATGIGNTLLGYAAGYANAANGNTLIGYRSGQNNSAGYSNVAIGTQALYSNNTVSNLVAVGDSALYNNGLGAIGDNEANYNTAVGSKALFSNTKGYRNTAEGYKALYLNTTGYSNTANGNHALFGNTTGNLNTANGSYTLYVNTTGGGNTANGAQALYYNNGNANTATGNFALYFNSTGSLNTANGYQALYSNTTGYSNVAVGMRALFWNTTQSNIVAVGDSALFNNGTGAIDNDDAIANTATGSKALFLNTQGSMNTANGCEALYSNGSGVQNTANGYQALFLNVASGNTATGYLALSSNATGINNTAIGTLANVNGADYHNSSAVGAFATITASNQVRLGNSTVTSIGGYANWTNISDGRVKKNIKANVPGLTFINKLKPVTYNLDLDAADKISAYSAIENADARTMQPSAKKLEERKQKEQILYTGFVAQDVEKAAKELNYDFSGVDAAKNDKDLYGLRYAEFVVPLVKAVQELSQQDDSLKLKISQLENLKTENAQQNKTINDLEKKVEELTALLNSKLAPMGDKPATSIVQLSSANTQQATASLAQNIPNPFDKRTTINYTLPSQYTSAKIVIVDKSGAVLKQISVTGKGQGSLQIDAGTLAAGAYHYSLFVDGKLIASKQMEHIK